MSVDVRLLVVSPPCIEAVNRAVYRDLFARHGIAVHLVVPEGIDVEGRWKKCLPTEGEPFPTTLLPTVGRHPRLRRLAGLETLIESVGPTHILLDGDPGQMIARQVWRGAGRLRPRPEIWVLTAENQRPVFFGELGAALRDMNPSRVAGAFIIAGLRHGMERRVDRVFTLSRDGTRAMEESGFSGRAHQIPLGFDPSLFHEQATGTIAATRKRLGLREKTFAYFGRVIPQKGLHLLVDALADLKDRPWQLLLDEFSAHGSPYADRIKAQIASRGLSDRVVFFNAPHAEMADYFNAADFVVLPSVSTPKWKEQYGRVLVEAMACGRIPVASDSGAIPEVLGDCGVLFPEGDVRALTAALRRMLLADEAELAPLRAKAKERAHGHLTIFNQADAWERIARASP